MSRRFYVESSPEGRPQFVTVKRSRSYHHHRHSCDYYKVSRKEWDTLVQQNEQLEQANQDFAAQNEALRARLHSAEAETHRLCHVVVPQLRDQVEHLTVENECLRRSIDNNSDSTSRSHRDMDKLRTKVCRLEGENKTLRDDNGDLRFRLRELSKQIDQNLSRRVCDLTKQIEYWTNQSAFWKKTYEELRERHIGLITVVESKTDKIEVYEDILKRRRVC